jgi:hypothetical protein
MLEIHSANNHSITRRREQSRRFFMPWCDEGDDGVTMVFYFIVTAKTLVKSGFPS